MIEARDLLRPADAAHAFRVLLDGFAKPGTVMRLPEIAHGPASIHSATALMLLSLCDYQTPVWLSARVDMPDARTFLRFHTGAPLTTSPVDAAFAVLDAQAFAGAFPRLSKGTDEYPDRAATAIVQVAGFSGSTSVVLDGPGLKAPAPLSISGFNREEWDLLAEDRILFPLGIDVVFVSGSGAIAVPRSTRITLQETG